MDHYECSQSGRFYRRSLAFCRVEKFLDYATRHIQIRRQIFFGVYDTVLYKNQCEKAATNDSLSIQAYKLTRVVSSKKLLMDLLSTHLLSGCGAAHYNGLAESANLTIVSIASVIMMHAALKQELGVIAENLWPLAMDHTVWRYNRILHPSVVFHHWSYDIYRP